MSEDRLALLDRAQSGDSDACGKMLEENSGLIWAVVRRYYGCGADPEDLYQLGCIGFIKAVKGFDVTYGTQFSTYAVPKIAGEIRRFLRDDGPVKVGRTLRERGQSIWSARAAAADGTGEGAKAVRDRRGNGMERGGDRHGRAGHRRTGIPAAGNGRGADAGVDAGNGGTRGGAGGKNCAPRSDTGTSGAGAGNDLFAFL